MKTKLEIIEETANYYNINNRGINGNWCVYKSDTGNMCAVGRCLKENIVLDAGYNENSDARELFKHHSYDILKDEYKIKDSDFWLDLQRFHDHNLNWDEKGLTDIGKLKYKELKIKYTNE